MADAPIVNTGQTTYKGQSLATHPVPTPSYSQGDGIYIYAIAKGDRTMTRPTGFAIAFENATSFNDVTTYSLWYKKAGSSEPSTYSFTLDTAAEAIAIAFSVTNDGGVDVVSPNFTGNSSTASCSNATSTVDDSIVLRLVNSENETLPHDLVAGATWIDTIEDSTSSLTASAQYETQETAGSVGQVFIDIASTARWGARTVIIQPCGGVPCCTDFTNNWLGTWAKRRQICVCETDVDDDLTDFPLHVRLSTASGKNSADVSDIFDDLGSNSLKIAFTEDDGTTQLYGEVVYWDATSEESAEIWVRVPSVSDSTGTNIYMYYDNSQSDNTTYIGPVDSTAGQNVWVGFECVFHLSETSGDYLDSTPNDIDSTLVSVTSRTANGFNNNNSPEFVETNTDNINLPALSSFPQSRLVEIFTQVDLVDGSFHGSLQHRTGNNWLFLGREGSQAHYRWHLDATNRRMSWGTLTAGTWHYIAGSLNQSTTTAKGYIDDNSPNVVTSAGIPVTTSVAWWMGYGNSQGSESWDGIVDEMRVSSSERSDGWAKATNDTLRDNFSTWCDTEERGYGNIINTVDPGVLGKVNTILTSNIATINTV